MALSSYCKSLLDIIIPPLCLVCGGRIYTDNPFCQECLEFKENHFPFCSKCGINISPGQKGGMCRRCLTSRFYFDRVWSPFLYQPPLSNILHLFKYQGYKAAGEVLSRSLISKLTSTDLKPYNYDLVSCVPFHARKAREREYNQSYIFARHISRYFGIQLEDLLGVKRYLPAQVGKGYFRRKNGLIGNFYARKTLTNKRIILVDDVFTTGATVSECSRILKDAGAKQVLVITLAITDLKPLNDAHYS